MNFEDMSPPELEDRQALLKSGPSENNKPLPAFVTSAGVRKMRLVPHQVLILG